MYPKFNPNPFPPIVKTSWYIEIHKVFYQIHLVEKVVFRVFPDLLQFELIDCSLGLPQISHRVTSQEYCFLGIPFVIEPPFSGFQVFFFLIYFFILVEYFLQQLKNIAWDINLGDLAYKKYF